MRPAVPAAACADSSWRAASSWAKAEGGTLGPDKGTRSTLTPPTVTPCFFLRLHLMPDGYEKPSLSYAQANTKARLRLMEGEVIEGEGQKIPLDFSTLFWFRDLG